RVNTTSGEALQWMPDNRTLMVLLVPTKRAAAPTPVNVPREPNWQESTGRPGPVRTFQDLLKTPHDEDLFEYYATAQLAMIDSSNGKISSVGAPGIFRSVDVAP